VWQLAIRHIGGAVYERYATYALVSVCALFRGGVLTCRVPVRRRDRGTMSSLYVLSISRDMSQMVNAVVRSMTTDSRRRMRSRLAVQVVGQGQSMTRGRMLGDDDTRRQGCHKP